MRVQLRQVFEWEIDIRKAKTLLDHILEHCNLNGL